MVNGKYWTPFSICHFPYLEVVAARLDRLARNQMTDKNWKMINGKCLSLHVLHGRFHGFCGRRLPALEFVPDKPDEIIDLISRQFVFECRHAVAAFSDLFDEI